LRRFGYTVSMARKVFKTGHSYAVTLSKKLLTELGLAVGDSVGMEFDKPGNRIIIKKEVSHDQLSLNLTVRPKLGNSRK
jgi:antitoxin component of MazEF toxin-antitoxin module